MICLNEIEGTMLEFLRSFSLFIIAGICEIGGGWLMWKWLRDYKPCWSGR